MTRNSNNNVFYPYLSPPIIIPDYVAVPMITIVHKMCFISKRNLLFYTQGACKTVNYDFVAQDLHYINFTYNVRNKSMKISCAEWRTNDGLHPCRMIIIIIHRVSKSVFFGTMVRRLTKFSNGWRSTGENRNKIISNIFVREKTYGKTFCAYNVW